MRSVNENDSVVWSKGDVCMSPYSGDNEVYRGVIQKVRRSPAGDVLALIKFDGYGEDDMEEINVNKLEKVKNIEKEKGPIKKRKHEYSPASGGMFSPLQGSELSQRLKDKYERDEDDEFSLKNEKLSSVLFGKKSPGNHSQVSSSRKGIVAVGGETGKGRQSKYRITPDKGRQVEPESPRSVRRKGQLEVTGGQAKDFQKELITSKRLSDISSIVDSDRVKTALQKHGGSTRCLLDVDDISYSGFTEKDMEKPKFTFTPEGAKVPLLLSGEGVMPVIQVPGTLNQFLRDYQREGIKFLYSHYINNRGAILGDDMGLGKTVQVIGFLSALLGKQGNRVDVMRQKPQFIRKLSDSASVRADTLCKGPYLIIGPGCVLYNWLEEFETWGYFSVRKYHGSDKADCIKEISKRKVEVVVTTFETFREHMDELNTVAWDAVIVDEVHKIKDMKARTTKALREINTMRRYGLTGTALQNNLLEFWSILDWARPGCLGSQADYVSKFVQPIELGQRHDANKRELATARKQKEKLAEIRKSLMIRRVKSLIADQLPKKDDSVVFCKLSQLQVSIYQTILDEPGMDLVIHGDDPCACDSGEPQSKCCKKKTADGQSIRSLRFTFMHLLLKTANHVALLIPKKKTSEKQADTARKICKAALSKHPEFLAQTKEASFKTLSDPKYCGKMKVLQGLLKVFYKEHSKVLVFSYSTQVLDIIEQHLMSTGYEYRRIDGAVSSKKRLIIVREFNTDPDIFICLISTKAGGLGLNLTGANKVVIFDPNWNPTHDLQAQDRAYRIGQRRDVQVYRLVSTGTIEENMYLRQIYKQQLLNVTVEDENARRYFYAVQGNPRQKGEIFGIKNMFVLKTGESCITRDIIKRNERVESALEGFDTAQYVPPVVRIEEDEDYDSGMFPTDTTSVKSVESEDPFAEFFSSDDSDHEKNEDNSLMEDGESSVIEGRNSRSCVKSSSKGDNHSSPCNITQASFIEDSDLSDSEAAAVVKTKSARKHPEKCNNKKIQQIMEHDSPHGKVKPSDSKTGKGPVRKGSRHTTAVDNDDDDDDDSGVVQYDQTLAGSFTDVSDVFDNCGVVHIHKNVKVVGGSRAEDHMTRCAISDVYEHHQHSQDLAAQCEPMSESSEEELPEPVKKGRGRHDPVDELNTARSTMIGKTKVLIGQTPKAFKLKYFEEISKRQGAASLIEFAELVLGSSLEDRIKILNSFYTSKDPAFKDIHKVKTSKSHTGDAETVKSCSKRKYERGKATAVTKTKSSKSKVRSGQCVTFLDDIKSDSESLSEQMSGRVTRRSTENSEQSSMEVGRKISPWKKGQRSPYEKFAKKSKVEHKSKHSPVPPSYCEGYGEIGEEDNRFEKKMTEDGSVESQDLLDEMGRNSEAEDGSDERDDKEKPVRNYIRTDNSVSSILDDIFGGSDAAGRQSKKPPPSNVRKIKSPTKKMGPVKSVQREKSLSGNTDPFSAVDEIFGDDGQQIPFDKKKNDLNCHAIEKIKDNECVNRENEEVHLYESTLKDDHFDCFDDPKLWVKRKRKEPDKRNKVDRMIEESDTDFNDLFANGKLRRKEPKSHGVNSRQKSNSVLDGSASLFS